MLKQYMVPNVLPESVLTVDRDAASYKKALLQLWKTVRYGCNWLFSAIAQDSGRAGLKVDSKERYVI